MLLPKQLASLVFSGGVVIAILSAPYALGEVLFEENFDDQPDFTSTMYTTKQAQQKRAGAILPDGWDSLYNETQWSPETGYPDKHASLEILAANADKAIGGAGKSMVNWRESYSLSWKNWASDSQLIKFLDRDYDELYIEFQVRFSPNWWHRGSNYANWQTKLFRVGHYDGTGNEFSPSKGSGGPVVLWYYQRDAYGVRNVTNLKGGPAGENYNDLPDGGGSLNFTSNTAGNSPGGADPQLLDLVNGGYLVNYSGATTHEQVYGPTEKWTKVAFYVRINSAVGVPDGVFRQWIDGERIINKENIPWVMANVGNRMVGWNYFAIGGNDYFQPLPNEDRFEDWYAIDGVKVMTTAPDGISVFSSPNPPTGISIN